MGEGGPVCAIHFDGAGNAALAERVQTELTGRGVRVAEERDPALPMLCVARDAGDLQLAPVPPPVTGTGRVLAVCECTAPGKVIWSLLAGGVADVVRWTPDGSAGESIVARLDRWRRIDQLVDGPVVRHQLIGRSPAWLALLRRVVETARFTDSALLLTGESGTGKELLARLVHHLDARTGKGNLILADCTTIVPTLSGSEFFGHERGAFTGATSARDGAFAAADRGTLFLDEVGELPLSMQAELLRVIQEGTYKRVGGDTWRTTRFRLVCATNRDLLAEVGAGRFRLDLYHRIAANVLRLPPLRERPGDVLPLFRHFLREAVGAEMDVDPAVEDLLRHRDYPGNVRDLRQLAIRVATRHVGPPLVTPGDLPEEEWPAESTVDGPVDDLMTRAVRAALAAGQCYREIRDAASDTAVRLAIDAADGNLAEASRRLGVTARKLQLWRAGQCP